MSTPTSFVVPIFLHLLSGFHETMKEKKLRVAQSYRNVNIIGCRVQLVTKAWTLLFERVGMTGIAKTLLPYMWYDVANA